MKNLTTKFQDMTHTSSKLVKVLVSRAKGSLMDEESYREWIRNFIEVYTDCFRDIILYIADCRSLSNDDYLLISILSNLYKVENKKIMQGFIDLDDLMQFSVSMNRADSYAYDTFSHDKLFNKKLHVVIDRLYEAGTSVPTLLGGEIANLNTLAEYSKVNQRRPYRHSPQNKSEKEEVQKEDEGEKSVSPFKASEKKSERREPRNNPYKKSQVYGDGCDADWSRPCGEKENLVLFYVFFYLSLLIDKIRGIPIERSGSGKILPPITNLRVFAKLNNTLFVVFIALASYYLLFYK